MSDTRRKCWRRSRHVSRSIGLAIRALSLPRNKHRHYLGPQGPPFSDRGSLQSFLLLSFRSHTLTSFITICAIIYHLARPPAPPPPLSAPDQVAVLVARLLCTLAYRRDIPEFCIPPAAFFCTHLVNARICLLCFVRMLITGLLLILILILALVATHTNRILLFL